MQNDEHIVVDDDLVLEILHPRHATELHRAVDDNRDYLSRTLPWADESTTLDEAREFIDLRRRVFENRRALPTVIVYRGDIAGGLGLDVVDPDTRTGELGYWLAEDRQGLGLMTRSARALLHVAFDPWRMHRIEIHTTPANTRSCGVAERLGFVLEGTKREAALLDGEYVDLRLYSLLAEEFGRE
jgi:ribosomal-protein-serine acetyltransferase